MTKTPSELRAMFSLAMPLVLAELGWMAMGIVDTIFVGRVSAEAIGAVSIGTTVFHTVALIAAGLTLGLDTFISQAFGARDPQDMRRSLVNGIWLALLLTPMVMGSVGLAPIALRTFGINPDVLAIAIPYMRTLNWSTLPLLLFFVLRRYLQSQNVVRPIIVTLIGANLVNILGNWIFVFGNLGAPRMEAEGSGWATFFSRLLMLGGFAYSVLSREEHLAGTNWRPDFKRIAALLRLGVPASVQIGLEFAVWTGATLVAGRFPADVLAGHQIALMTVSTTYMMPLGVSSAAAVRVGQALGRGDGASAAREGWAALAFGSVIMSVAAVLLLAAPRPIAALFTPESEVIAAAVPLLRLSGFFQLFDGLQVVATGALRGVGDTKTPAICHFAGYWLIGMPLGVTLALRGALQALGLWIGLSLGVIVIGSVLLYLWRNTARKLQSAPHTQTVGFTT